MRAAIMLPGPAIQRQLSATPGDRTNGLAAWYGGKDHHQKVTSSGERFDHHAMTAAHRTLPFGSLVKVTNLRNNKSVVVRITDRGPIPPGFP